MPSFRTKIPAFQSDLNISHTDSILSIGSCFAENMAARLERLKFPVLLNPFGIVYNPVSLVLVLEKLLSEQAFEASDLFEHLGLWHSFAHHGRFSDPDPALALSNINHSFQEGSQFLKRTNRLLLTLGTAHVFVLKKRGEVVANCHKIPSREFVRRRLPIKEIVLPLISVLKKIKNKNPSLEVIVSVSPVRHLRDGLEENQRSKATLLLALEEVVNVLPFVQYFPAYELMLDDLRDYRFYEKDLAHPNEVAVDYIWEYFEQTFFDDKTTRLCHQINKIKTAAGHRPFHRVSVEHQSFIKNQLELIEDIKNENPTLDFRKEKEKFISQLIDKASLK